MFADSEASQKIAVLLAERTHGITDNSLVAEAITKMFVELNATLTPIIGPKGVAALYRRSAFVCGSAHADFSDRYKTLIVAMDLTELQILLTEQSCEDAIFFSEQLLKTFYDLLATLVGRSLAARLLLDVWGNSLSGPPPQEASR